MSAIYQLESGPISLRVDPEVGARITHFSFNQHNALFEGLPEWGSTFWPSPQHAWGWPPPPVLDSQPYRVKQVSQGMSFTSAICPLTGLQLHKTVAAVADGFNVSYRMCNVSASTVSFAPWEITRVAGGLTFFVSKFAPLAHSTLTLQRYEDSWWHAYEVGSQEGNIKAFANGSDGWLANAYKGLLILKRFAPVACAQVAPEEAEIEIYAHGDPGQAYIEVEQQGVYTALLPGDELAWTVRWSLFEIPAHVEVASGSPSLLAWVKSLL